MHLYTHLNNIFYYILFNSVLFCIFLNYPIDSLGKVLHQSCGWWRRYYSWQIFTSFDKDALHSHAHCTLDVVSCILQKKT